LSPFASASESITMSAEGSANLSCPLQSIANWQDSKSVERCRSSKSMSFGWELPSKNEPNP